MKNNLYAFGALVLLFAIFFIDIWMNNKEYVSADGVNAQINGLVLEKLNRPNWNPTVFCGMPSFESLQYNPNVYFPNYILQFFGKFYVVLYFAFGGFGIFLICKYLNLSELSSLSAAAFFGLSPWLIGNYAYGHGSQIMSAMFIPYAFLFVLKISRRSLTRDEGKETFSDFALLSLVLGLQLQRGHVQIAYYTLLLCACTHAVCQIRKTVILKKDSYFKTIDYINSIKRPALYFAGAIILALTLASNLYIPIKYYEPYSIRSAAAMTQSYATNWSLHPLETITFILPDFYGFGGRNYTGYFSFTDFPYFFGVVPLGLACYALWQRRREPIMLWIGSIAVLSLIVAFGHYTPFYGLLYKVLPYFSAFRVPTMIIILTYFSFAILFGAGLMLVEKKYQFGKFWSGLLIASAVVMLWLVDSKIGTKVFKQNTEVQSVMDFQLGKFRVHPVGNLFSSNIWGTLGLESTGGYHAAKLSNYQNMISLAKAETNISPSFLAMTGSNFVISPFELDQPYLQIVDTLETSGTIASDDGYCFVYHNRYNVSRVYLVGDVIAGNRDTYKFFDPSKVALMTDTFEFGELQSDSTATYKINQYDPELVSISVKCQKGQLLVLNDVFYPGWHSYLDGEEVRTYKVNYCFRGVYVPAGEHTIVFKYHKIVRYSAWISYGALVLILGIIARGWYADKKAKSN